MEMPELIDRLTDGDAREAMESFLLRIPDRTGAHSGAGIVIPGGGERYLAPAWVCIRRLRDLGCALPIQLWHLGPEEAPEAYRRVFERFGVELVDARALLPRHPSRILNGWE